LEAFVFFWGDALLFRRKSSTLLVLRIVIASPSPRRAEEAALTPFLRERRWGWLQHVSSAKKGLRRLTRAA
jgi:hypothetical protein